MFCVLYLGWRIWYLEWCNCVRVVEEVTHIRRHLLDHIAANIFESDLIFVMNLCILYLEWCICDRGVEEVTHIRCHLLDHIAAIICERPRLSFIIDVVMASFFCNPILCFAPKWSLIMKGLLQHLNLNSMPFVFDR